MCECGERGESGDEVHAYPKPDILQGILRFSHWMLSEGIRGPNLHSEGLSSVRACSLGRGLQQDVNKCQRLHQKGSMLGQGDCSEL